MQGRMIEKAVEWSKVTESVRRDAWNKSEELLAMAEQDQKGRRELMALHAKLREGEDEALRKQTNELGEKPVDVVPMLSMEMSDALFPRKCVAS